ncbi:unnamed protein product [Effrenium voratum]|nr:unnamed protein product [Effrenium voratum]
MRQRLALCLLCIQACGGESRQCESVTRNGPKPSSARCCVPPIDWTACWYPDWRPSDVAARLDETIRNRLTACCGSRSRRAEQDFRNWADMLIETHKQGLSLTGLSKSLVELRRRVSFILDQHAEAYFGMLGDKCLDSNYSLARCCLRQPSIDWRGCWLQPHLAITGKLNEVSYHEFVWDPVTVHFCCEAAWSRQKGFNAENIHPDELLRALDREADLAILGGVSPADRRQVLVYTQHKSGSTWLESNLRPASSFFFRTHDPMVRSLLYDAMSPPCTLVSTTRNPFDRLISHFFETFLAGDSDPSGCPLGFRNLGWVSTLEYITSSYTFKAKWKTEQDLKMKANPLEAMQKAFSWWLQNHADRSANFYKDLGGWLETDFSAEACSEALYFPANKERKCDVLILSQEKSENWHQILLKRGFPHLASHSLGRSNSVANKLGGDLRDGFISSWRYTGRDALLACQQDVLQLPCYRSFYDENCACIASNDTCAVKARTQNNFIRQSMPYPCRARKAAPRGGFLKKLSSKFRGLQDVNDVDVFRGLISTWQFPSSCEGKKFLVAAVPTIPGLANVVLTSLYTFQLALRLNRIFVLDVTAQGYANPKYCPDRKFKCYLQPITTCSGSKKGWNRHNIVRHVKNLEALDDIESVVAWITYDPNASIPDWIASQLKGHYGLDWLYHQLAEFLLRPGHRLQKAIQKQIEAAAVPPAPFLSVHFRAGATVAKLEGFRRSLELYLAAIREAVRLKGLKNVLWASDDATTFQKIQVLAQNAGLRLSWFQVPRRLFPAEMSRTESTSLHPMEIVNSLNYDSDEMSDEGLQVLALVFFLSASQYSVLGQSSGMGRLIAILRGNVNLHDVDNLVWVDGPPQFFSGTQCFLHDIDCVFGNYASCLQREQIRRNRTAFLKKRGKYDRTIMSWFSDQELL